MAMTSSRLPFGGGGGGGGGSMGGPSSPAPTTASSLNYSQYGGSSSYAASPSHHRPGQPSISSSYSNRTAPRQGTGLRPSLGGGGGGARPGGGAGPSGRSGDKRMDSREIARSHFKALKNFLREWLENESPSTRASARDKLTRLTKLQFQELSTDVYDELIRRLEADNGPGGAAPFLPVRDDFHPKRNQARQKLATLPKNRFRDLASDVFFELRRRFPEFQEEEDQGQETMLDDEPPPAPGPMAARQQYYNRNGPTPPPIPRSGSASHQRDGSRNMSASSSRSHPSQNGSRDFLNRSTGSDGAPNLGMATSDTVVPNKSRLKEEDIQVPYSRDSVAQPPPMAPMRNGSGPGMLDRPTNDVVVPNKSRLREEDIQVPFSRDDDDEDNNKTGASGNRLVDRPTNDIVVPNKSRMREEEVEVPYARESRMIDRPRSSASSRHSIQSSNHDRDRDRGRGVISPQTVGGDDREYYDRMSFSSNVTSKSRPGAGGTGWDEEKEQKIRAEYEFRIAGLERKVSVAEGEIEEAKKKLEENDARRREDDDEIRGLKERAALHASNLRSMQHELDIAKDSAETARSHVESSSRQAQEEIQHWRERSERLEDELRRAEEERSALETANAAGAGGQNTDEAVEELKREIHTLVDELQSLSARNDALIAERERDAQAMNEMEAKVDEYKRMYDAARVELRNLKATSLMFVPKPASDDHLPASPDGNIADINVLAFQTAIDGLLSSARSSQPSQVLSAMKSIVEAVTEIGDDVKQFEAHPNLDVDVSRLESLKYESTNRLNALMQAARNHAMSSGLSPVSLIDGAAGHLSANVVEIIKLLKIRRSDGNVRRNRSSMSIKDMVDRSRNNGTPDLRSRGAGTPTNDTFSMRSGTPTEGLKQSTSTSSRLRDYGTEERLREPMSTSSSSTSLRRPLDTALSSSRGMSTGEKVTSPVDMRFNGNSSISGNPAPPSNLRINSYVSSASSMAKSDSFDLDRKPSITSDRQGLNSIRSNANGYSSYLEQRDRDQSYDRPNPERSMTNDSITSASSGVVPPKLPPRNGFKSPIDNIRNVFSRDRDTSGAGARKETSSPVNGSSPLAPMSAVSGASMDSRSGSRSGPVSATMTPADSRGVNGPSGGGGNGGYPTNDDEVFGQQQGGSEQEWEDMKPYLETQSSALVNSIQNLLAAIRTGGATPALNEHLSEVIAIASSIVAISTDALPSALRAEGNPLLKDLVGNTNKLSEAQESAKKGGFDKAMRQVIASASFGVAKSLKSLMKLGTD